MRVKRIVSALMGAAIVATTGAMSACSSSSADKRTFLSPTDRTHVSANDDPATKAIIAAGYQAAWYAPVAVKGQEPMWDITFTRCEPVRGDGTCPDTLASDESPQIVRGLKGQPDRLSNLRYTGKFLISGKRWTCWPTDVSHVTAAALRALPPQVPHAAGERKVSAAGVAFSCKV